jgi:hypothetical protein
LSLWLIKHHAMKTYWRSGGIAPRILELGTRGEWSTSRPGRFTPRDRAPGTNWIGGWVGPRAGLDAVAKIKVPCPNRKSNSSRPARSLFTDRLSYLLPHCIRHSLLGTCSFLEIWQSATFRRGQVTRVVTWPTGHLSYRLQLGLPLT